MRDAGCTGVPSSASVESRSTGAERGASSPSVHNLTKRGSADSGYSDGNTPSSDPDANGYFSGWNKLKKAVWDTGEVNVSSVDSSSTEAPAPAATQLWDKLLAATTPAVQTARGDGEDDSAIGPDGDTRLGRCIKEYHISRASDASELPAWLFTPAELAARAARSAAAARGEAARDERDYEWDYERPNRRSQAQDAYSRPAARR